MQRTVFEKFKKMMNLTFASNDHEALAALRKANGILTAEGIDWDRVLNKLVAVAPDPVEEDPDGRHYGDERAEAAHANGSSGDPTEDLIKNASAAANSDASRAFARSVAEQWRTRGKLTERQRKALYGIIGRANR